MMIRKSKFSLWKLALGKNFLFLFLNQICMENVQIWVMFWSVFSRIHTKYGDLYGKYPFSVRFREKRVQKKLLMQSKTNVLMCLLEKQKAT